MASYMARTQDWRVNAAVCKEVLEGLGGFLASAQQAQGGQPEPQRPSVADAQVDAAMQALVRTPRPAPPCACPWDVPACV